MRVVFLGSPPFATGALAALCDSSHEVALVVTPPPKKQGRGQREERNLVADLALEKGLPLLMPERLRTQETIARLREARPDILAVVSYGALLTQELLDLAPRGAINVHGSLLPRWRGASPIQAAVLAGDTRTGISVQQMTLALDAGDVLLERATLIGEDESAGELFERLQVLGAQALCAALDGLQQGTLVRTAQDADKVTHCRKITKEDGRIDFRLPAKAAKLHIRAMTPWPGATTLLPGGRSLIVTRARVLDVPGTPGELLPGQDLVVACGQGSLWLERVKPAGKAEMDGSAFLRGARLSPGMRMETAT